MVPYGNMLKLFTVGKFAISYIGSIAGFQILRMLD